MNGKNTFSSHSKYLPKINGAYPDKRSLIVFSEKNVSKTNQMTLERKNKNFELTQKKN